MLYYAPENIESDIYTRAQSEGERPASGREVSRYSRRDQHSVLAWYSVHLKWLHGMRTSPPTSRRHAFAWTVSSCCEAFKWQDLWWISKPAERYSKKKSVRCQQLHPLDNLIFTATCMPFIPEICQISTNSVRFYRVWRFEPHSKGLTGPWTQLASAQMFSVSDLVMKKFIST